MTALILFAVCTAVGMAAPVLMVTFIAASSSPAKADVHNAAVATPVAAGGWTYPLVGPYSKGRGFGADPNIARVCAYCSTYHEGYDMSQGCGAPVHAAAPGRVATAGSYFGYGNAVVIDHGGGIVTVYGHMAWGSLLVAVGQMVNAGTPLGAEGNTGHSLGCHLHFEVRVGGKAVDPQPFMAARGLPLK
ncbi:M23 family metallopeptidase [Microbacterium rhizosphaerae]|uniref:M23 family metallopeptidase n=1 Tax=Microbacterium rhizosphaerae TaxID=1678237 RepID=A0ABZ0SNE1_9MICO|nr:M23 family metallopeptidase [Microbacterium rhizosphaerae]WPR89690.1 M23 family metallopeptidase [Microbacterium rhizosphaerae]